MASPSSTAPPSAVSWQDVGYRCPRPGFFLGDDGSLAADSILLPPESIPSSPSDHLGRLGRLPLELLHEVVAELAASDVHALVALRNGSRAGAAVVDSFSDFATVAAFPRALGALLRMPPGSPVTLQALAACLRSTSCAACERDGRDKGDNEEEGVPYGDYIYLLTPERVCYRCLRSKPEYLPVAVAATQAGPDVDKSKASIRVAPGRYGVLACLGEAVDLFDRRQSEASGLTAKPEAKPEATRDTRDTRDTPVPTQKHSPASTTAARPDPLRYAVIIPAPYWAEDDHAHPSHSTPKRRSPLSLDRGFACRACAQVPIHKAAAGWADPLARYTRAGLQRHVADARLGGCVLRRRDARTGADVFEHAAPRRQYFAPAAEYGAVADLARRYEAVVVNAARL